MVVIATKSSQMDGPPSKLVTCGFCGAWISDPLVQAFLINFISFLCECFLVLISSPMGEPFGLVFILGVGLAHFFVMHRSI